MQALAILLNNPNLSKPLLTIAQKVRDGERITFEEGVHLYEHAELGYLGVLANYIREKRHGNKTYFDRRKFYRIRVFNLW